MRYTWVVVATVVVFSLSGCATILPGRGEPLPPSYVVGDRGPAGGTVIFDKGYLSDRWRYLEAAPEDLDRSMNWYMAQNRVVEWEINGYADWRLPTLEELEMIFNEREGMSGLARSAYWSATSEGSADAWQIVFDDGTRRDVYKHTYASVRAVRAF